MHTILPPQKCRKKVHRTHATCADEQDVVGAVHGLHSVHQQFAELVVSTHSDQEGALSQRQHIFLKQFYNQKMKYIRTDLFY